MRGSHDGFDCAASRSILPSNFAGGGGSCFPSMVVVALGDPGVPLTCCAIPGPVAACALLVDDLFTEASFAMGILSACLRLVGLGVVFLICNG